jgi:two-component system sensor kinase FixL
MTAMANGQLVNWITVLWPAVAGMSFALGLVYLVVWLRRPQQRQHLLFSIIAVAAALGACNELNMLAASTPGEFAAAGRIGHLTMGVAILLLPMFVRMRFDAGRPWLLYSLSALRVAVIAINLVSAVGVHFSQVAMHPVLLPGGVAAWAPVGVPNPWILLAHLNLLLILVFLADVLVQVRRRGDRAEYRSAWLICGSVAAHVVIGGGGAALAVWGMIEAPLAVAPTFLLPILALSYELGDQVLLSTRERARLYVSESRLRENEERWELAGQIAGIAPWSWSAASGELLLSPKARELFGIRVEGFTRIEDWTAGIHPEDAERVRLSVQQSMEQGDRFERNYRMLLPDGRVRWIGSRGRIERDDKGKVTSMYGVSFDLTGMRQADAMFRAALEAAPNAIFLVDGEGAIRLANARASRLFGRPNEDLLGLPLEELVPGWPHRLERRGQPHSPPGGFERRARAREMAGRGPQGMLPVELQLRPVEGGLLLASVTDISERLNAERESAQQRTELAHLSRVAVLGEMSATLAHELNQPLTAILSNSQAALRFLDGGPEQQAEVRETLLDIAASGTRAGDVIRRLRAMLKKEDAQQAPLDVNQLIGEVLQLYRSDLINRGVVVRTELDHGLPLVRGDRVQLQQVLLNLVINACDAMASTSGERRLCVCSRRGREGEVEFAVCDVGPGIEPDRLEQVFEPFVTSKPSGMGLGLSVCKTIVKSHGGRIWANNNAQGPGAAFHVALTAIAEANPPRAAAVALDRS